MTLDRPAELFTSYDLGVFCMPEFSAYENAKIQNMIINMSRHICSLFSIPENPLFWVFGGTSASLVTHTATVLFSVLTFVQSQH